MVVTACVGFVLWQLQPDLLLREHHAGRRRHGRPRVGPRLPPRPPAAPRPARGLDARLVRRLPRVPVLHGAPVAADRAARRRVPRAASPWSRRVVGVVRARCGRGEAGAIGAVAIALLVVAGRRARARRAALRRRVQAGDGQRRRHAADRRPTPSGAWPASASPRRRCWRWRPLPFLFYRGFTIYGGNIPSTLAGEFAFSISLSLALLYLGVVFNGPRDRPPPGPGRGAAGPHRPLPPHPRLLGARRDGGDRAGAVPPQPTPRCRRACRWWRGRRRSSRRAGLRARRTRRPWPGLALLGLGGVLAGVAGLWLLSESVRWLTPVAGGRRAAVGLVGRALLPAVRLPERHGVGEAALRERRPAADDLAAPDAVGHARRRPAVGLRPRASSAPASASPCACGPASSWLVSTVAVGVAFVVVPEGRLWNGRLLPFYYLSALLLAALAVSEVVRAHRRLVRDGAARRARRVGRAGSRSALAVVVVLVVALPLGPLPVRRARPTTASALAPASRRGSSTPSPRASSRRGPRGTTPATSARPPTPSTTTSCTTMAERRRASAAAAGPCGSTRRSSTATARRWR